MFLNAIAENSPNKAAIIMAGSGETMSYRDLNKRTIQASNLFRNIGLAAGDCIAIYMENSFHFMEIALGAIRAGLYFVPIGRHLKSEEVNYLLDDSGAKVIIISSL